MEIFGFDTKRVTRTFSSIRNFARPKEKERTWKIFTITGLLALMLISAFSVSVFWQIQNKNFVSADSDSNSNEALTLDREELNEAVSNLQKKRATFDLLRDRQPNISNPSQ
jgi:uncharacterized protein YpmS